MTTSIKEQFTVMEKLLINEVAVYGGAEERIN
jgi:hypothetical protein